MKFSVNYPTSKPVLNRKTASNIWYISRIKPLPSISLFNYHEAFYHPVCALVHSSNTIFLLSISLSPCILVACREKAKKLSHPALMTVTTAALAQPQTLPMHSMGVDIRGVLFYILALTCRLMAVCWPSRKLLLGSFSQPITWCLSCFSMSLPTCSMSAFSFNVLTLSSLSSTPSSHIPSGIHSPKIFCAFLSICLQIRKLRP